MDANVKECSYCGAHAIVEGSLREMTGGGDVAFLPGNTSYMKQIFGVGSRKIAAYACLHCSHLEFVVEFTDKDRQKYQQFDGPQPGFLERIEDDL